MVKKFWIFVGLGILLYIGIVLIFSPFFSKETNSRVERLIAGAKESRATESVRVRAPQLGAPWVHLQNGYSLPPVFDISNLLVGAPEQFQPVALTSADFEEDGIPELVSAVITPDGGQLSMYRGNIDLIFPNSPKAKHQKAYQGVNDSPFVPMTPLILLNEKPDFIGSGDFDFDKHIDLIVASRGKSDISLLKGDGKGGFPVTQKIYLPGMVTFATTSQIYPTTRSASLAITVQTSQGTELLFLNHIQKISNDSFQRATLSSEVTTCTFSQFSEPSGSDLILALGPTLYQYKIENLLHKSELSPDHVQHFPDMIKAITSGHFSGKQRCQLAVLTDHGHVFILSPCTQVFEVQGVWPTASSLGTAHVSNTGSDNLLVLDQINRIYILLDPTNEGITKLQSAPLPLIVLETESSPLAVLPMQLNPDGLTDLVILTSGTLQPSVVMTAYR